MDDCYGAARTDSSATKPPSSNGWRGDQYTSQVVLDHMPVGVVLIDRSGEVVYVNEYAATGTGYTVEELKKGALLEHPGNHVVLELLERARSEETPQTDIITQLTAKDGSTLWVSSSWRSVPTDGNTAGLVQMVFTDITAKKLAEEALKESEQKYKCIVENSHDTIMINLPEATISYMSPSCYDLLGYYPEELIGTMPMVVHPDDRELASSLFAKAISGESGCDVEYRVITKSGDIKWTSHSWSAVFSGDTLQLVVSVIKDITARKNAEEELRRAFDLQREFINNITHEVRTPLTAVQGYVQMILEGAAGPVSDEQATLLKRVLSNSDHLLSIVTGVLEIARTKSGAIQLQPKICSPGQIVEKAISAVTLQAARKGLQLNVELSDKCVSGIYDEQKVTIILVNLLTNAIKFTESGGIDVKLSCDCRGLELIVSDTGPGIASDDLGRIFDEFTQLDYPGKHRPSGFGIGLAIVATMTEAIQGSLTVSSSPGFGAAFTLSAPRLDDLH